MLVVIEGVDGSGKQTQTAKLYERLLKEGRDVRKIQFPNYESETSALVKMYLGGVFGDKPEDVNPYVASAFTLWTVSARTLWTGRRIMKKEPNTVRQIYHV